MPKFILIDPSIADDCSGRHLDGLVGLSLSADLAPRAARFYSATLMPGTATG